jgi:hypothetical protein
MHLGEFRERETFYANRSQLTGTDWDKQDSFFGLLVQEDMDKGFHKNHWNSPAEGNLALAGRAEPLCPDPEGRDTVTGMGVHLLERMARRIPFVTEVQVHFRDKEALVDSDSWR